MKNRSQIANRKSQILIAGAGPAGTSLAIRLAQNDIPVILIEHERFPRQKLCGEFISPECLSHFHDLGVFDQMIDGGGDMISETRFYETGGRSVSVPSNWFAGDGLALGLSRAEMDHRLMLRAKALGVDVREETTVFRLNFDDPEYCTAGIRTTGGSEETLQASLLIDATGRARALSKLASRNAKIKSIDTKARFVGFKTHLRNTGLEKGICEIYGFPGGYGGLSHVENGVANHCFLVKAAVVKEHASADAVLKNVVFQNRRAFEMLRDAEPIRDWLAVAVAKFGITNLYPRPRIFTLGDAAAFIDPFTGSGMLMAFESSELLAGCIVSNSSLPHEAGRQYQTLYRKRFARRLRVCGLLRHAAFMPNLAKAVIAVLDRQEGLRALLARSTRSSLLAHRHKH